MSDKKKKSGCLKIFMVAILGVIALAVLGSILSKPSPEELARQEEERQQQREANQEKLKKAREAREAEIQNLEKSLKESFSDVEHARLAEIDPNNKAFSKQIAELQKVQAKQRADAEAKRKAEMLVVDISKVVNQPPSEVAKILDEPISTEQSVYGEKLIYSGKHEVVYSNDKATLLTIGGMSKHAFAPSALEGLGLAVKKPTFKNEHVMRWENIPDLKKSLFSMPTANAHTLISCWQRVKTYPNGIFPRLLQKLTTRKQLLFRLPPSAKKPH